MNIPIENFVVATSGGADSLCLALLAHEFAVSHSVDMYAVFVDHKLRDESSSEILPIIKVLSEKNIKSEVLVWDHEAFTVGNLENRAREARYNLLINFCKLKKIKVLLVAHHLLDQWETFMMRLSRGSGLTGLCSMKHILVNNEIDIIRPLLNYTREDIIETLHNKFGICEYVCDPMNDDEAYERVRFRKGYKTFSKYGLDMHNTSTSISRLQRAESCLDEIAQKAFEEMFEETFSSWYIKREPFIKSHLEIQTRIIKKAIERMGNNKIISYSLLERAALAISSNNFKAINIARCVFRKDKTKNIKVYIEQRR
ncbi:MAG: tRNA lysidine(34) synthetase TilS [Holosporales bacterium]|nr:tRNA lysidine(34) synthetase TilS [Holosporales bacterium]